MPLPQLLSFDIHTKCRGCRGVFPTFNPANLPTCKHVSELSPFLPCTCRLFCRQEKLNSLVFNPLQPLFQKHPGVGYPSPNSASRSLKSCLTLPYHRSPHLRCLNPGCLCRDAKARAEILFELPNAQPLNIPTFKRSLIVPLFSNTSELFQVPYPVTPVFATLTKIAGMYTSSSQIGTRPPRFLSSPSTHYSLPTAHSLFPGTTHYSLSFLRYTTGSLLGEPHADPR